MEKIYNKLVRDKIPEINEKNGFKSYIRVLDDDEYIEALKKKLLEEYNEVVEASGKEVLEELADMYEVIKAIAEVHGSSMENISRLASKKKKVRGAFEKKIFLEKVDE